MDSLDLPFSKSKENQWYRFAGFFHWANLEDESEGPKY